MLSEEIVVADSVSKYKKRIRQIQDHHLCMWSLLTHHGEVPGEWTTKGQCGHGLAGLLNDMIGLRHQELLELTKGAIDLCLSDRSKGGWPITVNQVISGK